MQQRLVEARLELLGDDEYLEVVGVEALRGFGLTEAVHAGLGEGDRVVQDFAAEGDQRREVAVAALGQVAVNGLFVTHRVQAGRSHHHGLGPSADLVRSVAAEVLDDDLGLLGEVGRV